MHHMVEDAEKRLLASLRTRIDKAVATAVAQAVHAVAASSQAAMTGPAAAVTALEDRVAAVARRAEAAETATGGLLMELRGAMDRWEARLRPLEVTHATARVAGEFEAPSSLW
jgi:hypothetical protein